MTFWQLCKIAFIKNHVNIVQWFKKGTREFPSILRDRVYTNSPKCLLVASVYTIKMTYSIE